MLVMVTLFWGISYWLINISLTAMDPFTLNALRFLTAFLIAFIFSYKKLITVNKITLKYSAFLGTALLFVYIGATFGVRYTSLSNAGFLCSLTVVITPILAFFVFKQRPEKKLLTALFLCIIGIGLMTLNAELKPALGDILCILCAFAYSVHLLIAESAVKKESVNAYQLGVFQLAFTGIYNLIIALFTEKTTFDFELKIWMAVLFLSIFCTGLAFIIQVVAQQYTSASHVGVIFSLEPVFAGFAAFFLAGEILAPRAYVGAFLMLISIFVMELDIGKIVNYFKKCKN